MNLTESDCKLPPIYPFTGKLSNLGYANTLEILHGLFCSNKLCLLTRQDTVECIRIKISLCNPSVVKNKNTGLKYVNVFKRNSRSVTFNHEIVGQITEEILPCIKSFAQSLTIPPEQIIIDQSHGDILYYEDGCFFSDHRDQINVYPAEIKISKERSKWRMYSLIVSLDSNIIDSYEGATKVYLPSRSWILDEKIYQLSSNFLREDGKRTINGKKTIPHVFTQSCRPMHFVIFPSEALHGSCEISRGNNLYKMALKLDLWLKIPRLEPEKRLLLSKLSYTDECTCDKCDTRQYRVEQAVDLITDPLWMFHHNILLIVAEYGIATHSTLNRKECICNQQRCPRFAGLPLVDSNNKSVYKDQCKDENCVCNDGYQIEVIFCPCTCTECNNCNDYYPFSRNHYDNYVDDDDYECNGYDSGY